MDFHGLAVQDIRGILPRSGAPMHGPLTHRALGQITGIAVHWDAEERPHAYDSIARYVSEANYHINEDWGNGWHGDGLMYHFKIDNTGVIFYTRDVAEMVWAVTDENPYYISICLDGGPGQQPTHEQAQALQDLLNELCFNHPEFPASQADVRGHQEVPSNATQCPGTFMACVHEYRNSRTTNPNNYAYDYPPQEPVTTVPVEQSPAPVNPVAPPPPSVPEPLPPAPAPGTVVTPEQEPGKGGGDSNGQQSGDVPVQTPSQQSAPVLSDLPEFMATFAPFSGATLGPNDKVAGIEVHLKYDAVAVDLTSDGAPRTLTADRPFRSSGTLMDNGHKYYRGTGGGWYAVPADYIVEDAPAADAAPAASSIPSAWGRFWAAVRDPFGALIRLFAGLRS